MTPARVNPGGVSEIYKSALQRGLTAREANVLMHMASGKSDKKIGEAMKISQHTAPLAHPKKSSASSASPAASKPFCKVMTVDPSVA